MEDYDIEICLAVFVGTNLYFLISFLRFLLLIYGENRHLTSQEDHDALNHLIGSLVISLIAWVVFLAIYDTSPQATNFDFGKVNWNLIFQLAAYWVIIQISFLLSILFLAFIFVAIGELFSNGLSVYCFRLLIQIVVLLILTVGFLLLSQHFIVNYPKVF